VPELPEVEVVRRGLEGTVVGRTVADVEVHNARAVRRHPAGAADFAASLAGQRIVDVRRRGKYLWLPLGSGDALLAHLGMSGQLLVVPPDSVAQMHLRVRIGFADGGDELRFVDQRTFGSLSVDPGGAQLPVPLAHIARDLLDQSLVSGIGNIYADEALWRSRLHYARPTETLPRQTARRLLADVRAVMVDALRAGGTSFDALYVNVDGESGYFDRSLDVYGRAGEPCRRCGAVVRREPFMNRSSFRCPRCQPQPRQPHW
jgi:formamidopyrimidine-DNA glycosylase